MSPQHKADDVSLYFSLYSPHPVRFVVQTLALSVTLVPAAVDSKMRFLLILLEPKT